jgi:cell division protein YceG involved in septum cleavage
MGNGPEALANAEYIVRCVNHHDSLIQGIRTLTSIIESEYPEEDERYKIAESILAKIEEGQPL